MIRMQCRRCGREAFTGKVTLDKDEQVFICWKCSEKEEPKEKKELSELSDEELLEELREAAGDRKERTKFLEEYEKFKKWMPSKEPAFDPHPELGPHDFPTDMLDNKDYKTYPTSGA